MSAPCVPLQIFSCYTMIEGAIEPKAIARRAKRLDFPAAAPVATHNERIAAKMDRVLRLDDGVLE